MTQLNIPYITYTRENIHTIFRHQFYISIYKVPFLIFQRKVSQLHHRHRNVAQKGDFVWIVANPPRMMCLNAVPDVWIEGADVLSNKTCITAPFASSYNIVDERQVMQLAALT